MIFFSNYQVRYINLESRKDRNDLMLKSFDALGIKNFKRIDAITTDQIDIKSLMLGNSLGCRDVEVACSFSNLIAIKDFVDNSSDEYGIFCEDDADLSNLLKVNFTIEELFQSIDESIGCVQLGTSTREDLSTNFYMHHRTEWDFNTSTYILKRSYAKDIVEKYFIEGSPSFKNFESYGFIDYRNNSLVRSTPVAEFVVYGQNTITIPIVTYFMSESSIQNSDETVRQNIKSKKDFLFYWSDFIFISLKDLFPKTNDTYFSKPILSRSIVKNNIKVVIPWRKSASRITIFEELTTWYKNNFPDYEIIYSDTNSEIFNLSASRNLGIKKAFESGAEAVVVTDADFFPSRDGLIKAIFFAIDLNEITLPYKIYNELSYIGTTSFLNKDPSSTQIFNKTNTNPVLVNGKTDRFWVCSGLLVIPKTVFSEFGGFDENFIGWGPEDQDYHKRYFDRYGKLFYYVEGTGCSLEHSREEWKLDASKNLQYFKDKHGESYIL